MMTLMPCFYPLKANISYQGTKRSVVVLKQSAKSWEIELPCGKCHGCRLEKSREWAMRVMHEASLYNDNCFITLTYDDDNVPEDGNLDYTHFQNFMKYLRRDFSDKPIRFYMAGEYGSDFGRPHFHACLFNFTFDDLEFLRLSPTGCKLFRSPTLERLWPKGFSSVGSLTFESAAYVARYIMSKLDGPQSRATGLVDYSTGEVYPRVSEFNRMSLKPGIGANWFHRYQGDVFPHDRVVVDGQKLRVPRYYDKLYEVKNPAGYRDVKTQRIIKAEELVRDTPDRLKVKEAVSKAAIINLKRGFKK